MLAGYCSDMTRTVCLGAPSDPRLVEVHDKTLTAGVFGFRSLDDCSCGLTRKPNNYIRRPTRDAFFIGTLPMLTSPSAIGTNIGNL